MATQACTAVVGATWHPPTRPRTQGGRQSYVLPLQKSERAHRGDGEEVTAGASAWWRGRFPRTARTVAQPAGRPRGLGRGEGAGTRCWPRCSLLRRRAFTALPSGVAVSEHECRRHQDAERSRQPPFPIGHRIHPLGKPCVRSRPVQASLFGCPAIGPGRTANEGDGAPIGRPRSRTHGRSSHTQECTDWNRQRRPRGTWATKWQGPLSPGSRATGRCVRAGARPRRQCAPALTRGSVACGTRGATTR